MELTKAIKDIDTINDILSVYPKYSKNYMLIYYLLNTGLRISDTMNAKISDHLAEKINMYAMKKNLTDEDYIFLASETQKIILNAIERIKF